MDETCIFKLLNFLINSFNFPSPSPVNLFLNPSLKHICIKKLKFLSWVNQKQTVHVLYYHYLIYIVMLTRIWRLTKYIKVVAFHCKVKSQCLVTIIIFELMFDFICLIYQYLLVYFSEFVVLSIYIWN